MLLDKVCRILLSFSFNVFLKSKMYQHIACVLSDIHAHYCTSGYRKELLFFGVLGRFLLYINFDVTEIVS